MHPLRGMRDRLDRGAFPVVVKEQQQRPTVHDVQEDGRVSSSEQSSPCTSANPSYTFSLVRYRGLLTPNALAHCFTARHFLFPARVCIEQGVVEWLWANTKGKYALLLFLPL